jgi:hypothetical protein
MHLSSFIHLNTIGMSKGEKTKGKAKWTRKRNELGHLNTVKTSARLCPPTKDVWPKIVARDISTLVLPSSEEKTVKKEETKAKGLKVEAAEKCEEELPDNPPSAEEDEPPEDGWFCPHCSASPCQFLQWQEGLERIVGCMNPDKSNKQKRFELYGHVTRRRHGTLGKGNRKPLPSCFEQGHERFVPIREIHRVPNRIQQWTR